MAHKSDEELIRTTHNTARFFTENRQLAWVVLFATIVWGIYGYVQMPKRKDPQFALRRGVVVCPWPGANAEIIEQLVTTKIEEQISQNPNIEFIESVCRGSVTFVYFKLLGSVTDEEEGKQYDDISLRLANIRDLPSGAGPIQLLKDFSDTAAVMLTVASPKVNEAELGVRAQIVKKAIEDVRSQVPPEKRGSRVTAVLCLPQSINPNVLERRLDQLVQFFTESELATDARSFRGQGFIGLDAEAKYDDSAILTYIRQFLQERLHSLEIHPDVWELALIRNPDDTEKKLTEVAGDKYSYRELENITDLIQKTLQTVPQVSKVTRKGVLEERIYLEYSQEKLASYGVRPSGVVDILKARNITLPGGVMEVEGKNISIDPSGEFQNESEIGDVLITATSSGTPVYLRNGVDIFREYINPPRFLNFYNWQDSKGRWQRSRAVTLAVNMRSTGQVGDFGKAVDEAMAALKQRLPEDLILARTSDQPLQVKESIGLFNQSLYEAILLVILVAFIGFREWRSAVVMATSIPTTMAMTYGMMHMLGLDLQQVSIASLILALGLLVDDPVVAGDAIKRDLAHGHKPIISAWLGPTKLAKAIMYATVTNIVAYLPLLTVTGEAGDFIFSLPIVLACSLIASRLVSMTFIPLIGYYLLRPQKEPSMEERRSKGFAGWYYKIGTYSLEHRYRVLLISIAILVGTVVFFRLNMKTQFFPKDLSYLSYLEIWLPEDAPVTATNEAAQRAEQVVRKVAEQYGREHPDSDGNPREILESITTFVGGGGPRFWFSAPPELPQQNYSQMILQVKDKHDTQHLIGPLQMALSSEVVGARVDVRQLESGPPIGVPVSFRISGFDKDTLRKLAEELKGILRATPGSARVRDDWGAESFVVKLEVDPDRANLAGVTNSDVALSSVAGMNGLQVTTLREKDKIIPVMLRLNAEERAKLSDIENLYVYSIQGTAKVPLRQVSSLEYDIETEKIIRRNQFRTITVGCYTLPDVYPSEVYQKAISAVNEFKKKLPLGYKLEVSGERIEQEKGFSRMSLAMGLSVLSIYLALVVQFKNAIKPLIVFAAIPFGLIGALLGLGVMGSPFGFMAFLGIASLIGVIISHIIVLFDFVEEEHEKGAPFRQAVLDAGVARLRPVSVTVGATVFGLIPLALHGGPLWEPLCYAQIGGLLLANFVTKLLVPAVYAIFVQDLKIVKWDEEVSHEPAKLDPGATIKIDPDSIGGS